MYLIIESDYTMTQSTVLSGKLRARGRRGECSIVNTTTMQGMNIPENHKELGEWSDIPTTGEG